MFRIGLGHDTHVLIQNKLNSKKSLILGGVKITNEYFLEGNSDGDLVLHAICNALSTAIGGRSIGTWADDLCLKEGISDSKEYVYPILEKVKKQGYKINNVVISIECKIPKIEPHSKKIQSSIAKILEIKDDQIGIAATSGEGLTAFGKGKGIQVFCNILISKYD